MSSTVVVGKDTLPGAFKQFSKSYSAPERTALFHDTAVRAYRINDIGSEAGDARLSI